MARLPLKDPAMTPTRHLLPKAIEATANSVDSHSHGDAAVAAPRNESATEDGGRDCRGGNSTDEATAQPSRMPRANFNTRRCRRNVFAGVGVLACASLLIGVTSFLSPGIYKRTREGGSAEGVIDSADLPLKLRGGGDDAGANAAASAAVSARMQDEASSLTAAGGTPVITNTAAAAARTESRALAATLDVMDSESTALLVAVGEGERGRLALKAWSDFVLCAREPTNAAVLIREGKVNRDCGCGGQGAGLGGTREHVMRRVEGAGRGLLESPFPSVWVITSDPFLDMTIGESMPHLSSFFVSGLLGSSTDGAAGLKHEGQDLSSWTDVLARFLSKNPKVDVIGMFGEGTLPTAAMFPFVVLDPADPVASAGGGCRQGGSPGGSGGCAIESALWPVLAGSTSPTAVVSRSRAWWTEEGSQGGGTGSWMPDKFLAQVWCNRAMLASTRTTAAGLGDSESVGWTGLKSLLSVIQRLVRNTVDAEATVVDGTEAVPSRFLFPPADGTGPTAPIGPRQEHNDPSGMFGLLRGFVQERKQKLGYSGADATASAVPPLMDPRLDVLPKADVPIGALHLALSLEGDDASVWKVAKATWPPSYILATVRQSPSTDEIGGQEGLVVVTSVNCGYIDVAINSLVSIRQAAEHVKVLYVATDEVAFDFFDGMLPGQCVLMPSDDSETPHAVAAGAHGDNIFRQQTILRPDVLLAIGRQGYRTLWIDTDTVWLGNVLSILPEPRRSTTPVPEVVITRDGPGMCTCLIYLDSTPYALKLLELWKEQIVAINAPVNQRAFQQPLEDLTKEGMRVEILPREIMPAGRDIFVPKVLKERYQLYLDHLLIIHNNWVRGHEAKVNRFRNSNLWHVDDWPFPRCSP